MDLKPYLGAMPDYQLYELRKDQDRLRKNDASMAGKNVSILHAEKVRESIFNEAKAVPGSQYYWADAHSAFADSAKKYNQYLGSLSQAIDVWRANNIGRTGRRKSKRAGI
jgi:hypothetical protein